MGAFRRFAFATTARDATFVALAAATLMLAFSNAPALALSIGANIALAVGLVLRAACLKNDGIDRSEAWLTLLPEERPPGDLGRRYARDELQDVLLRFAKAAAAVAIVLYATSLIVSLTDESRSLHALVGQAHG